MAQRSGDSGIAAFAQSIELGLVQTYAAIGATGIVTTPAAVNAIMTSGSDHDEHAQALGDVAGSAATSTPNRKLVNSYRAEVRKAADERALLDIAYRLENQAAATYLFALGVLEATGAVQLAASILPVESQHAVALATLLGKDARETFPTFQTQDEALKPDEFPVS
jgi:hypothetical protein